MSHAGTSDWGALIRRGFLLAAAACIGLAVLSHLVEVAYSDGTRFRLALTRGQIRYHWSKPNTVGWSLSEPNFQGMRVRINPVWPELRFGPSIHQGKFGFSPFGSTTSIVRVFVPLWLGLLLALPAFIHAVRIPAGHCRKCRYDLRAVPAADVCPECGQPAASPDASNK